VNEQLVRDINDRLTAIGESVSEGRIQAMVTAYLDKVMADEAFVRKMRFGGGASGELVGTKYARWGLSIADVEWLFDVQSSLRGQKKVSGGVYEGPSQELTRTFEALSEALYVPQEQVREMDRRALDDMFPRIPLRWFHGADRGLARAGKWQLTSAYEAAIRAMDTAESGYGAQLIGAQYVGQLWEAARTQSRVFALLDSFEMTAPTVYIPVEVDIPELLFVGESTTYNATAYTTVKTGSQRVQVDAKKFVIHQMWSGELEEDSIIPFVPFLRRQAQLSLAHYSDSLVLNGDTTNAGTGNINLDDADPADTKHYLAFDGIRHVGLVDNTANQKDAAGAVTLDMLLAARGRMVDATRFVDWGHPTNPEDLVYVAELATADAIAAIDEFRTMDMYGRDAVVFTGEVGRIGRHPLIPSMALSKTEADGKVSTTAGNNTKGVVVPFNRRGFKVGWRRRVQVETERIISTDQTRIVYSLRMGFGRFSPTGAASGIEAADIIYDITL
jgi:hypothetical protein